MATQQGKWKEEQILIIAVGTQTTLAQVGCHELTPPVHRMPTRMFQDPEGAGWRPYHTFKRKNAGTDDEEEWVEDKDSDEGAIYPLHSGRIVNMEAFLAFLDHVHTSLAPAHHNTPIMLIGSPHWSRTCKETITRFIFEKTKTPALCLMHSALATQYGLKWPNMTVVDIGFQKVDVSCIYDGSIVNERSLGVTYPQDDSMISGGELFTRSLYEKLKNKGFTYEMAEQLKKSPVAEVLPFVNQPPLYCELPKERGDAGPAPAPAPEVAAPGTGADGAPTAPFAAAPSTTVAAAAAASAEAEEEASAQATEDGVLDVAAIVTSGQTKEFLARKEKEKAEKSKAAKRGKDKDAQDQPKLKLPNNKRTHNIFHYEEIIFEVPPPVTLPVVSSTAESAPKPEVPTDPSAPAAADAAATAAPAINGAVPAADSPVHAPDLAELPMALDLPEGPVARKVTHDIEVGPERLTFISHAEIERIADTIYRAVQGIPDAHMRAPCWDCVAIVGNGSRVRGLKEHLLATLTARYLISPSSASMLVSGSELPSGTPTPSAGTPGASGTATPAPAQPTGGTALLQAAVAGDAALKHHHGQTPMSIKLAQTPTYLGEWAKHGYEEAVFLGAQVAARMAFCLHNVDATSLEMLRGMSLSRVDYNEIGPKAIRRFSVYR